MSEMDDYSWDYDISDEEFGSMVDELLGEMDETLLQTESWFTTTRVERLRGGADDPELELPPATPGESMSTVQNPPVQDLRSELVAASNKEDLEETLPPTELTWILDLPIANLKLMMASFGLSTLGSEDVLKNRLNRYHQTRLQVPNVRWNPEIDCIPAHAEVIPEYLEPGPLRVYLRGRGVSDIGDDDTLRRRMRRLLFKDEGKDVPWDPIVDGTPDRLPINIQAQPRGSQGDIPIVTLHDDPVQSVPENTRTSTTTTEGGRGPLTSSRPLRTTKIRSAYAEAALDQYATRREFSEVLQIYEDRLYSILNSWRAELAPILPSASSPVGASTSGPPMPDISVIPHITRSSSLARTTVTTVTGTRPTARTSQASNPCQVVVDGATAQAHGGRAGTISRPVVRFQDTSRSSRGREGRHSSSGSESYDSESSEYMSTHSSDCSRHSSRHRSPSRGRERDYGAIARNWQLKFSGDSSMTSDEFLRRLDVKIRKRLHP
ncbi:hypothetical protein KQX54_000202, partial [Cotesia glomerata]